MQGTITSCRKAGSRLAFHVEYDDGDTDVEALGEAGAAFKWHGPRARSGDPPYHDTMRAAMAILRPQNLQQDADPAAQVRSVPRSASAPRAPGLQSAHGAARLCRRPLRPQVART